MTHPFLSQKNPPRIARLPAELAGFCCEDLNCPECLQTYRKGLVLKRQERAARKLHQFLPGGLKTAGQAAAKLGCSIKTLNGHVASGALKYVALGHGRARVRRMFADADLDEFIANQTRKDVSCPSTRTGTAARRTSISISKSKVIGFMEARSRRRDAKPKR
jgi:hypothetical protein